MATTITAGNSTNGAAAIAPDNTGILELKTGSGAGTTALTLGTSQEATFAGQASFASQVTFSNQLNLAAGTAAAPSITFSGDTNTGIFSPAADTIAFSEGGTEVARINSDAQIVTLAGTAALPVLTFTGDVNTGIYSPGADRIGFTEGGTQVGEFDASGNFLFNSGYGSVAVAYGCRAWVNFNGTGAVSIRASRNVSTIGDNGNGDYTVNFSNAMPDANYVMHGTGSNSGTVGAPFVYMRWNTTAPTTLASRIGTVNDAGSSIDNLYVLISVFR
jgi:hypothetical protein